MPKIVVLGAGVMGSAMTVPAVARGHDVHLVGTHLDEDIIASVAGNGFHPTLNLVLPEPVKPHRWVDFADVVDDDTDLIILGVSSAGVGWAVDRLCEVLKGPVPILMVTKGLAAADGGVEVLPYRVAAELKDRIGNQSPVMAIAGPAIAGELAAERETATLFTGADGCPLDETIGWLGTPYYHPRISHDVIGVEVCAAFKNFYALAVGTAKGRVEQSREAPNKAAMHNLAAGLFTQVLMEMSALVKTLGGDTGTVHGLAGTGDLYVTCQAGRNSRMGRLLGMGIPFSKAKAEHMPDDTVEGADLALAIGSQVEDMFADGRLDGDAMPLTRAVLDSVCRDQPFRTDWDRFYR